MQKMYGHRKRVQLYIITIEGTMGNASTQALLCPRKREQSLTEASSVRNTQSFTFAGQMCCWWGADSRTREQKFLHFISSILFCIVFTTLLILFTNIIFWVLQGKLHRYCLIGSHHGAYLSTLQVRDCIFQKAMNWSQWHGGSTCSFRGNET